MILWRIYGCNKFMKRITVESQEPYPSLDVGFGSSDRKLATKIKKECYKCRLIDKKLAEQQMSPLPRPRQVMSPTFNEVSLDMFGPYEIRDTVKQRIRKKVWGLILNFLATRAVHIDLTGDYGTYAVLQNSLPYVVVLMRCTWTKVPN